LDLQINDPTMDSFKVNIDTENNVISVYNNGRGIPIEIHSKEKIWIPELIFGNLCVSMKCPDLTVVSVMVKIADSLEYRNVSG
jgi:DNA topoisomerase-2